MERTVIVTKETSSSWYRMWSDGWLEQGGIFRFSNMWGGNHSTLDTCSFPRAFKDTNYHLRINPLRYHDDMDPQNTQDSDDNDITTGNLTRTKFDALLFDDACGTNTSNYCVWYACGF